MAKLGRPFKYISLLRSLDDQTLYRPATIAYLARDQNLVPDQDPDKKRLALRRIRIAMGRLSSNYKFPYEGDGMVAVPGQSPTPGWFGSRWKQVLG